MAYQQEALDRNEFYLEDDVFERFKPGEDLGLQDPSWSGGAGAKFGATSTGAPEGVKKTLAPIARVFPTIEEHAKQGWEGMTGEYEDVPYSEGWRSLEEPVSRGMGALQYLLSPISGAYTALFDEPVSETLQEYGGMEKETADLLAVGLGLALTGGYLAFAKWARINPFASEVLAEKLFGGTMPGTHWARGTVDADATRRAILKAGAATTVAGVVAGPSVARGVGGLIGRAGIKAQVLAPSVVLHGIGGKLAKFIHDMRRENAQDAAEDIAGRTARREEGGSSVPGVSLEDETLRITRTKDEQFYGGIEGDDAIMAIDEVFSQGPPGHGTKKNLNRMLEDAWIEEHAGVPVGSRSEGQIGDRTGLRRRQKTKPREMTPDEIEASIQRDMEELDISRAEAEEWVEFERLWKADPASDARMAEVTDSVLRRGENPPPWSRRNSMLEGAPPPDRTRFMDDADLWRGEGDVQARAEGGYSPSVEHFEEWDETLKALQWYQRNDPEGLLKVLRAQKALFDEGPTGKFHIDSSRLLDTLIDETLDITARLKKAERGRAPSPGSVQARLEKAADERLAKQEADAAKKKEKEEAGEGFSWLDPMGWRKHPWFGGKE